jgi:hypothetical protein
VSSSHVAGRIFVVGAPRSGTTLVQSLLAAHSSVTSFTESHFFSRHFRPLPCFPWAIMTRSPEQQLGKFLVENDVESRLRVRLEQSVRRAVRASVLIPFAGRATGRALLQVLDSLAHTRNASSWVEKTPMHLNYIRFIEHLLSTGPAPQFVHVVREGLDVVGSLHTASKDWQRSYSVRECAERWNSDVSKTLARLGSRRDHVILYESLRADPHTELERLLGHLELEWQPEILDRYGEVASQLVTDREAWKANVAGGVRPKTRGRRALTDQQREQAQALLRRNLYARLSEGVR